MPAIIGAANLMMTLSATVIANALPSMAVSFHVDPVQLNTTISVYMLALAVFLPVSGWAADRFGAKRVFLIAIALYAASCAACGFAANLPELLLARAAEGAAGALMGPVGRLVLLRTTPKHDLVRAMSVLTMPSLLGPVIGPPIGGLIVTYFSWQWIFFLNLPIAALGLVLVTRFIPEITEEEAPRLDWVGMILTGVGLAAVVFGFESLGHAAAPAWQTATLLGGGVLVLLIYAWHAKRTPHAILDLKLFKIPTFFASIVGGTFMRMGVGATPFLMALLLQVAFGMSALQAGLMTFASAAAALVMKTAAPPILARFGFRKTLSVNAVIVARELHGLCDPDQVDAALADLHDPAHRRVLPLAAVHGAEWHRLRRHRHPPDEPRLDHVGDGAAAGAEHRRRFRRGASPHAADGGPRQAGDGRDHRSRLPDHRLRGPDLGDLLLRVAGRRWRLAAGPSSARTRLASQADPPTFRAIHAPSGGEMECGMAEWWRGAVIYQIYPRSFLDTNGDGVGDLGGVRRGLDYLASLGVDGIWLSPFFTSPMKDFGYDVSDYCGVDPMFGTLADFDALLAEAHAPRPEGDHRPGAGRTPPTSTPGSGRAAPRARTRRPTGTSGPKPRADGTPPNNWLASFGGPAWTWNATAPAVLPAQLPRRATGPQLLEPRGPGRDP